MAFPQVCVTLKPELASLWFYIASLLFWEEMRISHEQVCDGEEGCKEQRPKALQGFSGRGGSEIGGTQGECGREYMQMILGIGPGREGQRWSTGTTLGSNAPYDITDNSLHSNECPLCSRLGAEPVWCILLCLEHRLCVC